MERTELMSATEAAKLLGLSGRYTPGKPVKTLASVLVACGVQPVVMANSGFSYFDRKTIESEETKKKVMAYRKLCEENSLRALRENAGKARKAKQERREQLKTASRMETETEIAKEMGELLAGWDGEIQTPTKWDDEIKAHTVQTPTDWVSKLTKADKTVKAELRLLRGRIEELVTTITAMRKDIAEIREAWK